MNALLIQSIATGRSTPSSNVVTCNAHRFPMVGVSNLDEKMVRRFYPLRGIVRLPALMELQRGFRWSAVSKSESHLS